MWVATVVQSAAARLSELSPCPDSVLGLRNSAQLVIEEFAADILHGLQAPQPKNPGAAAAQTSSKKQLIQGETMAKALLIAHVHPASAEQETEFNRWYDEVHIPQVLERIPGVVGASRHKYAGAQLVPEEAAPIQRYLSLYELDTEDLAATAQHFGTALADGTLELSEALNRSTAAPVLHFYTPAV
ncbi:hypothetical protein B0E55_06038 [Rhodococcus sp. 66b]|nr:hypothetical protein B0E55_06038 [Rhodococcus sp. 66b]